MYALLSLVVCLAGEPAICETVTPDYAHPDTGQPPTFFECLGVAVRTLRADGSMSIRAICCTAFSARSPTIRLACAIRSRPQRPEAAAQRAPASHAAQLCLREQRVFADPAGRERANRFRSLSTAARTRAAGPDGRALPHGARRRVPGRTSTPVAVVLDRPGVAPKDGRPEATHPRAGASGPGVKQGPSPPRYISGDAEVIHPLIHRGLWGDVQVWLPAIDYSAQDGVVTDARRATTVPVVLKVYPLVGWLWVGLGLALGGAAIRLAATLVRP